MNRFPTRPHQRPQRRHHVMSWFVIAAITLFVTPMFHSNALAQSNSSEAQPTPRKMSPVDEVIDLYEKALAEVQSLRAEVARLKLELNSVTRERDELKQFIEDYDEYGSAYEKYAVFVAQQEAREKARRAEIARQKREERKRRLQELREQRRGPDTKPDSDPDTLLNERVQTLRRAGFTRIGETVFVGQMGYVYKTENNTEYRYSPWLDDWYISEEEVVDYSKLTLSGSLIHAGDGLNDLSIAIAFYDSTGGQIGQTTVRVDGARPGVPYPFTSVVDMAAAVPFDNYTAWVLYAVPLDPQTGAPMEELPPSAADDDNQPLTPPDDAKNIDPGDTNPAEDGADK